MVQQIGKVIMKKNHNNTEQFHYFLIFKESNEIVQILFQINSRK